MIHPYNRRYIGSKTKINEAISSVFNDLGGDSFLDLFAGTATVSYNNLNNFKEIGINDFLFHNFVIYNAFFSSESFDEKLIIKTIKAMNNIEYNENIFSKLYGGKFFSNEDASKIWEARMMVENMKKTITTREYYILVSIIVFAADKASRSVGHFESFLRSSKFKKVVFKNLELASLKNIFSITNEDSNKLVKTTQKTYDIVYIDPPYNSRQYAYFYHVLETIALFIMNDKTKTVGVSAKPEYIYDKTSNYSKSVAPKEFERLINDLDCKNIVVSYNNTFNPSSSSSKNKISYEQMVSILKKKGKLEVKEVPHKFFNAGKTKFKNHKEYLFIVKVNND